MAQIIGPTLSVMMLSEMINLSVWESNSPAVTFMNGVLLFIAGISIIRVHNFWVRSWIVLVTLIGWLALTLGVLRMFFPTAEQAGENFSTYLLFTVLFLTGLFMSFKGYYPNKNGKEK